MKQTPSKYYAITRCVLYFLLGWAMTKTGADLLTMWGVAVYLILLGLAVVDALHLYCACVRSFRAGQQDMVEFAVRRGWRVR